MASFGITSGEDLLAKLQQGTINVQDRLEEFDEVIEQARSMGGVVLVGPRHVTSEGHVEQLVSTGPKDSISDKRSLTSRDFGVEVDDVGFEYDGAPGIGKVQGAGGSPSR